ncbi:MAG: hypothetical protein JW822_13330 [Spirochaetales bacterium]|nr:hypothetical protein [Spirochaetales bacterium]
MKSKFVFILLLISASSCISINNNIDNISLLSEGDCEQEYYNLLKSMEAHKGDIKLIKADNLFTFLDGFSVVYSSLSRDLQLAEWLKVLSIGDPEKLCLARKNRNDFINLNKNSFWMLRKNSHSTSAEQRLRVELWESIFEKDISNPGAKGSAEISKEIREIEDDILKAGNRDLQVLLNQEKQFKQLFKLRNRYAKIKGHQNHLYYIFTPNEVEEYNLVNKIILRNLPQQLEPKQNIGGLINPDKAEYFNIIKKSTQGMGLAIDTQKIKYFITHEYTYNRTFMTIIEPKNECRIYIFFPNFKLYPDEYLNYLSFLMHETGHGLHFQYMNIEPAIFNFFDLTVTETVAIFFENMVFTKEWIQTYFPRQLSAAEMNIIIKNRKTSILEFFRFAIFLWMFEKSVYTDPDQNMEELYKTLSAQLNMPKTSQYRLWYDTSIFASHDLYYIHYALAYLYAYKLKILLEKKYGPYFFKNPEAGNFLVQNLFAYGRSLTRKEIFKRIFGNNDLPVKEYIAYLME